MENKKNIFNYFIEIFATFGFIITYMLLFTALVGDEAKSVSTMYSLGSSGIPLDTAFEFFVLSVMITVLRSIFFTDRIIKNASLTMRTAGLFTSIIAAVAVFIISFGWFPINMWQPWAMFLLCFAVCAVTSAIVCSAKERLENRLLAEALERQKGEMKND